MKVKYEEEIKSLTDRSKNARATFIIRNEDGTEIRIRYSLVDEEYSKIVERYTLRIGERDYLSVDWTTNSGREYGDIDMYQVNMSIPNIDEYAKVFLEPFGSDIQIEGVLRRIEKARHDKKAYE
jgi:hypothetical protein